MKTSGVFTSHVVKVEAECDQPITLIPFGDVHRDSDMFSNAKWEQFLEYAKSKRRALFLGMGDYTDGVSTSERIVLSDHNLHDTTKNTLKDVYKGVTRTLVNELGFMRGRTVGLLGGNHFFDFGDGNTTDHVLANALGTRWLGVSSLIRLSFSLKGKDTGASLDIFAHHGKGGGTTTGGQFSSIEKMAKTAEADIYLMGHTHGKGCIPDSPRLRLVRAGNKVVVRERTPWLGRTGSFLKAYEDGKASYNVDAARSPCSLGWIEFEITPRIIKQDGSVRVEMNIRGTS